MAFVWDDRPWHLRQTPDDRADGLRQQCFETADEFIGCRRKITDQTGRQRLARAVSAAIHRPARTYIAIDAMKEFAVRAAALSAKHSLVSSSSDLTLGGRHYALERGTSSRPNNS